MQLPPAAPSLAADPLLQQRPLQHVVVLGANGTMGYGSGALFTQAVPKVTFLARTREKAEQGLAGAIRQVRSPTVADRVRCGSYEELPEALASADLVFEAVTEQLELKREFFERIDAHRRADSIVATVTSGLSIDALAEGRSESFQQHFLGLHFFNPPNVIVGTELVPSRFTRPEVVSFVERFSDKRLGRRMVLTNDRPGFAGNRIGFKLLNEVAQLAEEHGVALMERLVGPYTGRALTPLATIDLVGWDIHRAIVDNIHALTQDEAHDTLRLPGYMAKLMEGGTLGRKSGGGFTRREGKERWVLEPKTGRYLSPSEIKLPRLDFIAEVAALHREGRYREALAVFADAPGDEAALARRVIAGYLSYALHRVGEVTEELSGIDRIMGFGFNWAPPGVLIDWLGPKVAAGMIERAGLPVPPALTAAAASATPPRFASERHDNPGRYFVAA